MGRITGFYLLFQTLIGQALGPMLIAFGSERFFGGGKTGLQPSFALTMIILGAATVVSALLLRRGMAAVTAAIQV